MISPRMIGSLRIVTSLITQSSLPPGNRLVCNTELMHRIKWGVGVKEQQVIQIIRELINLPRNLMDLMQILRDSPTHQIPRTIVIMRATPNQENMKTAYPANKTNNRNTGLIMTQICPSLRQTTTSLIRARTNNPII